jgi:hypothetical protein
MKRIFLVFALLCAAASLGLSQGKVIAPNTKVYIEPNEGFETYIRAAFEKKKVPLLIVVEKDKADLVVTSTVVSGKEPGLATAIFLGKRNANQDASVSLVDIKSGVVMYSYSVHKYNAVNGKQSAAEAIAKNVKNKVESRK